MISNFGTLKAAVSNRTNRTDFSDDDLALFVRRAHDIIVGEVVIAYDLTISTQSTALPSDFKQALAVWLVNRPMTQLSEASPQQTQYVSGSGIPYCFRIDTTLLVYPAPQTSYDAIMLYQVVRTPFSADADTNAILTKYPLVYLYGAVAEAYRHLENDNAADRHEALFRAEMQRINQAEVADATRGALQMTSNGPIW